MENSSSSKISIPLRCWGEAKEKLSLIRDTKLLNVEQLKWFHRCLKGDTQLSESDKKKILALAQDYQLNELDFAELYASFLGKIQSALSDAFIESSDVLREYHKNKLGEKYNELNRQRFIHSTNAIARFALPRIRAKLAIQEFAFIITRDEPLMFKLISLSPYYLKCPLFCKIISDKRTKLYFDINSSNQKAAKSFFAKLNKAQQGVSQSKSRIYPYFKLNYYYSEVVACIETYKKIEDSKEKNSYKNVFSKYWGIPENFQDRMNDNLDKPKDFVLEIMTAKKDIQSPSTFRNKIAPVIKKIQKQNPYLALIDPMIEQYLLDGIAQNPELLKKHDAWVLLEKFDFDKKLFHHPEIKHSTSPSN